MAVRHSFYCAKAMQCYGIDADNPSRSLTIRERIDTELVVGQISADDPRKVKTAEARKLVVINERGIALFVIKIEEIEYFARALMSFI